MQKFTFIFTLSLLLILGFSFTNYATDKYDPEEFGLESVEETSNPVGIIKHPGTNDFSMLWDNFASGDTIADDVSGLIVTDASNDLDADGFAEIICSDEDGFTYVFENTGNDSFDLVWSMEVITSPGDHAYAPLVIADLNGNGLQEIVATFEDSAGIYFYEWDGIVGSDNYTEVAFLDVPFDSYDNTRTMTIDNLDSDINQELVIAQGDTCYVIEADAGFNFNIEAKMWGDLLDEVHSVITTDLNNNGSKEVIYCDWNYSAIHIWENTAEDTYVNVLPDNVGIMLDDEDGRAYEMIITNIDGDSYPEIFAVTSTEKLIVFEMQSSSWDTSASNMMSSVLLLNGSDDIKGVSSGDVDEDGNPDIYFVTDDMHIYDYEYNGGDIFDPMNYTLYDIGQLNGADAENIEFAGDMDGDGELEIVVGYEGSPDYPLLYFLEHYVAPQIPIAELNRTDFLFDHVWNIAEVDTELVNLRNIGAIDLTVDSIVSFDPVFTSYMANATVPALGGSEVIEFYFTALDQAIHDSSIFIIYSNSTTSPDTINVYGDSRERPDLFINEFQPDDTEWVELLNEGTTFLDLTDIGITHGENSYFPTHLFGTPEWAFVEYMAESAEWGPTQTIPPGGFLVSFTTTLGFGENQDWAYLVYKDSTILQRIAYGSVGGTPFYHNPLGSDTISRGSISRVANTGNLAADWTIDFDATPGQQNDAVAPALGSTIVINEVDYDGDVLGSVEHVEYYNPTTQDVQMYGWKLTTDDDLFIMDSLIVPAEGVALFEDPSLSMAISRAIYLFDNNNVRVDQLGFMTANPITDKLSGTLQRIPDGAGPNDGYDFWSSGGDVTLFDRTHTLGALNFQLPTETFVIFTAQIGGDANYRSFWMNGSWDSTGTYDPNWSGPMIELKNDGLWPDTSEADDIFSAVVQLGVDDTYNWWVGSEHNTGSFLEDGASITPDTSKFNYSTTCVVDPGDAGFNQWTIGAAGDSLNGWNNADDNLTRNGWEWSGNFALPAGPMEYKFVVMHSWSAGYGVGGVGGGNIPYTVPVAGNYTITFNDSTDTYTITEFIDEESFNITTPEITTSVTNEGTIGMLNDNGLLPGFTWAGTNQLFEGALMFGKAPDNVVDAARVMIGGDNQSFLDADFQFLSNINVIVDNADSTISETIFDDSRASLEPLSDVGPNTPIGLEINQTTYCFTDTANSGYVIYQLDITNTTSAQLDGIVAGAYFDWDVGTWNANTGQIDFNSVTITGVNGDAAFDAEFSYIFDPDLNTTHIGSVPLSQNYFLASRIADQPTEVYGGSNLNPLDEANKYNYMVQRRDTDPFGPGGANADKGIFIGLGGGTGGTGTVPDTGLAIPAGGTVTVGFALVGGNDLADFVQNGTAALQKWADLGNTITVFELVTGIESEMDGIPTEFALHQNYPNPFNPATTIKYDLKQNTDVLIKVYDMLGREVRTVINETQSAGFKKIVWNGTNDSGKQVSTGVYFYKIVAGDFVKTMKMILMK